MTTPNQKQLIITREYKNFDLKTRILNLKHDLPQSTLNSLSILKKSDMRLVQYFSADLKSLNTKIIE